MNKDSMLRLAELVLPGYGFFGARRTSCLHLPIGEPVDLLRLSLQCGEPNYLNLAAIDLFDASGKKLSLGSRSRLWS